MRHPASHPEYALRRVGGDLNALHTGSANAGGEIAPPPPGLIGQVGSSTFDRSGDFNALHTGSANAGGVIANPPPGFLGR